MNDTELDYNQNVRDTLKATIDWLRANYGPDPNRDATTWRVGVWNIETHYTHGEGTLHLWLDKGTNRKLYCRGRDGGETQRFIDALEECRA
ncbi:MAG TPA: hypothetical protein VJW23_03225 [Propionibacteriaceae bacterium]|nr:hypothetical protein [Propionibacteriaceae bacterium]